MSIALHYSFRKIDYQTFCEDSEIPEESVEQIYLKVCDLIKFPEWLFRMRNLTHINISCNAIERVPIDINTLENLNYLDLSDNQIMELPSSFFELTQLKYLDLSGNFLDCIPSAIKNLSNLELLNFDRNFLLSIPVELTECKNIFQLSFDECARLFTIPKNLFTMPKLVSVSFRGCSLITLPSIVPSNICHLSILGNQTLNCVPFEIFIKFIPFTLSASEFYMIDNESLEELHDARTNFIKSSPEIEYITLKNGHIVNVPNDFVKIFHGNSSTNSLVSLRELCMRKIKSNPKEILDVNCLPYNIKQQMQHPTSICQCKALIFSETYALFFQYKTQQNPYLCIAKFFCSSYCLKLFYEENLEKIMILS
ncbi:hypothetical protein PVAND_011169 [Polypedilum vanderplanki]|uniref:Disease resistance R13L4/SHOC-2-like LRR domain-containing protein n=1 Tax=Polypedilum vanderplanki TaxID=319348 RepID=A0A9J6CIN5_POLVA|nr:hypothetical protein PVAND_011169 [Polypedilum vanderplanki]